jgi:TonB family protein
VTGDGTVGDAQVLASNTVHLLNLSALSAVMEWRFAKTQAPDGRPQDGWRLVPFQFRIAGADSLAADRDPSEASDEGKMTPPTVLKAVEAEYPIEALNRRLEGTVVYRVQVDARGKMVRSTLEQGVHPLLDRAALDALERTRFSPARRGGLPVEGELLVPFTFRRKP